MSLTQGTSKAVGITEKGFDELLHTLPNKNPYVNTIIQHSLLLFPSLPITSIPSTCSFFSASVLMISQRKEQPKTSHGLVAYRQAAGKTSHNFVSVYLLSYFILYVLFFYYYKLFNIFMNIYVFKRLQNLHSIGISERINPPAPGSALSVITPIQYTKPEWHAPWKLMRVFCSLPSSSSAFLCA